MKGNKSKTFLTVSFLAVVTLLGGCGGGSGEGNGGSSTSAERTDQGGIKVKNVKLGQSTDFSILAYASITSVPTSHIQGKVGLMPGPRESITLDPSEVEGGAPDILTDEDETLPVNLLSNAKVDMVSAYNTASALAPDNDKSSMGSIDEKTLTPGVYEWSSSTSITKDFKLEGTANDFFIFKIKGHLKIDEGVQMKLGEGVRAENIIWQVAGAAEIGPGVQMAGTIIAQQAIELKSKSVLTGRAFCKNGFVNLERATIKRP